MLRKNNWLSWRLLGILFLLGGSGCATPPDVPVCVPLETDLGWCMTTMTEKEFFVDNKDQLLNGRTWSEVSSQSFYVPPESWYEIKAYLLKMCKKTKQCKNVKSWSTRMNKYESVNRGFMPQVQDNEHTAK